MLKQSLKMWGLFILAAMVLAACSSPNAENNSTISPAQPTTMGMMGDTPDAAMPNTGEMEFDELFINMMVPHHEGAVEMARIAQQRAEHSEVKNMADAIVASQEEEIRQMKEWKEEWYGSSDTPSMSEMPSLHPMPGMGGSGHAMNMEAEVERLANAGEPFDLAFIDMMIPHHQSAVDAAEEARTQATKEEIKELAEEIIEAQKAEIALMNAWREQWYPDAPPVATPAP